jgi:hypothetical protein
LRPSASWIVLDRHFNVTERGKQLLPTIEKFEASLMTNIDGLVSRRVPANFSHSARLTSYLPEREFLDDEKGF